MSETKQNSMKAFTTIAVIGRGSYAKVVLARHLGDNRLYAIKMLKKIYILQKNQERQIMMEKEILAKIDHPFLVKLKMCFQDEKKLYFVLQYCPGGQLFSILADQEKLTEDQAKFYAGQIILALQALHKHQIVYRDLKAQNIIVDAQGYIKLTDFGLSKVLDKDQTTMSICGTSEYLAPEMIKKIGYRPDVDWWCLGCLIYQMVLGFPPFEGSNRMQLFQNIVFKKPSFTGMSQKLADLLSKLLVKDPSKRLGHSNVEEIKQHPWFQKIKWEALMQRKYKAPFVPNLSSDIDTNNFDVEFTRTPVESEEQMEEENNGTNFKDFSFGD